MADRSMTFPQAAARLRSVSPWRAMGLQARGLLDGPPVPPDRGIPWLAETCVERIIDRYDAVVAFTGEEGVSKSTGALRLALAASSYAQAHGLPDAAWSWDRLCYTADDVLSAYERTPRGGTIWYDEGVRGLMAGETFDPEQEALVKALTLVREKGCLLVVCIPEIFMLAKKVRGRRASFWIHVEKRGTSRKPGPSVARVHERDRRLKYLPTNALGLTISLRCPQLTYEPYADDDPSWVAYQTRKNAKLADYLAEARRDLRTKALRERTAAVLAQRKAEKAGVAEGGP